MDRVFCTIRAPGAAMNSAESPDTVGRLVSSYEWVDARGVPGPLRERLAALPGVVSVREADGAGIRVVAPTLMTLWTAALMFAGEMILHSVVLPAPLGPSRPCTSPSGTSGLTPRSASSSSPPPRW